MKFIKTNLSQEEALETIKDISFYQGILTFENGIKRFPYCEWLPPSFSGEYIIDMIEPGIEREIAFLYQSMGIQDLSHENDNVEREIYAINGVPFYCTDKIFDMEICEDRELGNYIINWIE